MKATGIIRRVDDLGRVVIPKEIRRNLGIREGDPLEIFLHEDSVCFKKYTTSKLEKFMTLSRIWLILQKKKVASVCGHWFLNFKQK